MLSKYKNVVIADALQTFSESMQKREGR